MFQDLHSATSDAHRATLRTEAARERFARLAACCRPSALLRRAHALVAWLRAGQLGPAYVDRAHAGAERALAAPPCCA